MVCFEIFCGKPPFTPAAICDVIGAFVAKQSKVPDVDAHLRGTRDNVAVLAIHTWCDDPRQSMWRQVWRSANNMCFFNKNLKICKK
jgi:hypothetical protein